MSGPRPFHDYLRELRSGLTHDDCSKLMQQLVNAVRAEGKAGTMTLKITVKPSEAGRNALLVAGEVKATLPKPTEPASIWFATPEGNLQREDPNQQRLPLQDLGGREGPRDIGTPASAARALA